MPTKPTTDKALLSWEDKGKPSEISTKLLSGNVKPEDCPWVQIGDAPKTPLYVSVTITGDSSWLPLIAALTKKGQKKFVIFTGRHGDIPNLVDPKTKITQNVFDPEHTKEDEKVKKLAEAEFKDADIELVDAGKPADRQKNHTAWLKTETQKHLKAGKTVIYAWCYSLFTYFEADASDEAKMTLPGKTATEIAKTIDALTTAYFKWAD